MRPIHGLLLAALTGCAAAPAPVPLQIENSSVAALAGRWEGDYGSTATGRSGSIVFTLTAGRDAATGDVLMIPAGPPPAPVSGMQPSQMAIDPPGQVLTIRIVRVSGNEVRGEMDPYRAPDCDCIVTTTFSGTLKDGRIRGTFATYGAGGSAPTTGVWEVHHHP